jgi:hypothetical protein
LMTNWRATPSRLASLSNEWIIHMGKMDSRVTLPAGRMGVGWQNPGWQNHSSGGGMRASWSWPLG